MPGKSIVEQLIVEFAEHDTSEAIDDPLDIHKFDIELVCKNTSIRPKPILFYYENEGAEVLELWERERTTDIPFIRIVSNFMSPNMDPLKIYFFSTTDNCFYQNEANHEYLKLALRMAQKALCLKEKLTLQS